MVKHCSALALLVLLGARPAHAGCQLCGEQPTARPAPARALQISVETALDLGRAAQGRGGGSIALDANGRRVAGLVDLGGAAVTGRVRLTGEPFAHVRVSLPGTMRLTGADGGQAEVTGIRADAPPEIMLGADGAYEFAFGGRLDVPPGVTGDLRGRIAITADYQ